MSDTVDNLEDNNTDKLLALTKGLVGLTPYFGGILTEVLSITIPNQRVDRVVEYLRNLEIRIDDLEGKLGANSPLFLDLFEDSIKQASKAVTVKRNRYIANFFSKLKYSSVEEYEQSKKVFTILEELTDRDIDVLIYISSGSGGSVASYEVKDEFGDDENRTVGQFRALSDDERSDIVMKNAVLSSHIKTLVSAGLVECKMTNPLMRYEYSDAKVIFEELHEYFEQLDSPDSDNVNTYNITDIGNEIVKMIGEE